MHSITRRGFIGTAAAATAAAAVPETLLARDAEAGRQGIRPSLSTFGYSQVQLLDGPLKVQFDQNHEFFLHLSEDRLLKIFRTRAGLPAPGEWMSPWYDEFCPGAHYGQYVSALARFSAATNSAPTRAKVHRLVKGYAQTLDSSGRIFADLRYPGYTYDKLVLMLIDAHSFAGEEDAPAILRTTTQAAKPHMAEKALTRQQMQDRPHKDETYLWDETYTMAENLFLAYERLGDQQYFDMGKRYLLDKTFFDPLSEGQDPLPGLHAYSHVNAFSSGVQGYLKLRDQKYYRAVSHAIDLLWNDQSYATGGWGPNEALVEPGKGQLGASLETTHRSFETPCGAYAHFKLMRYMIGLTKDSRYGDSLERVLYNTLLGATPIQEDGKSFYYSDYHDSGFKADNRVMPDSKYVWDHDGRWPCCSGTLPQVTADYVISGYFNSADGVYVNLFVPSRLTCTRDGARCQITQQTSYPTGNLTTLDLELSESRSFSVYLRVPGWAGPNTSISVNGKRLNNAISAGSFHQIKRSWKTGDKIEFEIDQRIRTEAADAQTPHRLAVLRGPQVMFALTGAPPELTRAEFDSIQLHRAGETDWTYSHDGNNMQLRPFWRIQQQQTYQTYWKMRA